MLFSFIIPTYNRAHCITSSINSILNQSFRNFEIIIIDDGSKDNTIEILESYILKKQIQLIQLNGNHGTNTAKNKGVNIAKGEYLVFLDSDDELINIHSLKTINDTIILNNYPKISMFSCLNTNLVSKSDNAKLNGFLSFKDYLRGKAKGEYLPVIDRNSFNKVKFFEDINGGEHLTWLTLTKNEKVIFISNENVRLYNDFGTDRLSNINKSQYKRVYLIFKKDININFGDYIKYYPIGFLKIFVRIIYYKIRLLTRFK